MLVKALNYNLAFVPDLLALYPDARFVGVIRDGRAVCEGHVARGAGLADGAAAYAFVGRRLIELEAARPAAQDLALRGPRSPTPPASRAAVYDFCGLDRGATRGVCLQDKERIVQARRPASPACARSRTSTASRRWAGTCAPTPTPPRWRGCRRRRWPRSPRAAARCSRTSAIAGARPRPAADAAENRPAAMPPPPAAGAMTPAGPGTGQTLASRL